MSNTWVGSISSFDITVPDNVKISPNVLNGLRTAVENYNKNELPSSERSGSILNSRSVHFIWRQLLELIRADENSTSTEVECRRVVYEWCLPHPFTGTAIQLDFTFIPAEIAHLNWAQYSGGVDLKANPQNPSSSGSANTLGRHQAFSRAAMCVYARCEMAKRVVPKSGCRAYCIFADARQLGVARVIVSSDMTVSADVFGPVHLMGYNKTSDPKAFLVLKHLLTSPTGGLRELTSAPPPVRPLHLLRCVCRGPRRVNGESGSVEAKRILGCRRVCICQCVGRRRNRGAGRVRPKGHQDFYSLQVQQQVASRARRPQEAEGAKHRRALLTRHSSLSRLARACV